MGKRLGQNLLRAFFDRGHGALNGGIAGNHDDTDILEIFTDMLDEFQPAVLGHFEIRDHQIDFVAI